MKKNIFSESRFIMDFLMNVWSVISPYVLLIGGFVLLIKGADWFVDGSSSVAKLLKVPSIIIGLTVVALGTSLPEASVSFQSSCSSRRKCPYQTCCRSEELHQEGDPLLDSLHSGSSRLAFPWLQQGCSCR